MRGFGSALVGLVLGFKTQRLFRAKLKSLLMIFILCLLLLLVAVAFYTLLERKVLAYIMLRRGPNKPSYSGLLVPFADALKLLSKPFIFPTFSRS